MSSNSYMILGTLTLAVCSFIFLIKPDGMLPVMLWAGGAMFGKGYRMWEEKN